MQRTIAEPLPVDQVRRSDKVIYTWLARKAAVKRRVAPARG
jgi:hypothetical protein